MDSNIKLKNYEKTIFINIITLTHNRRKLFFKNFKNNLIKINQYIEKLNININWIINCDDGSINEEDILKIISFHPSSKINFYFYTYNYYFPRRYFDLMIKIKADYVWCLEDDDEIIDNFFIYISKNFKKYQMFYFYYKSDFKKLDKKIDEEIIQKKFSWSNQLSQMILSYKYLKKFIIDKKLNNKKFFIDKNYICYDDEILKYFKKYPFKIINKKIFHQHIQYDNMSINDLIKYKD